MPLRDHFRPPVANIKTCGEVHGQWPAEIVRQLFPLLPEGYSASPTLHLGSSFEIDVSTTRDTRDSANAETDVGQEATAALAPSLTVEADLSDQDEFEVRVYDDFRRLVAAVEIVSPANKDRPATRDQFVGKVAALLRQDVCVAMVDLVTIRQANLYAELLTRLGRTDPRLGDSPPSLYAVTLRARKPPNRRGLLDAWFYPMAVGEPLPTIPLWLSPDLRVMLPLEPSYQDACRFLRIP
jgi:Protein of unknown function (DUF4058)